MNTMTEVKSEVFRGDCMEGMKQFPDKHFELAIVDPPYGLGLDMVTGVDANKRNGRKNGVTVKHEEKEWNDGIPSPEYFEELHRVSRHQIIWGCNYYAQYIPAVGRIVHDKQMDNIEGTAFKWSVADLASCSLQKRITMFRYQWAGNRQNGTINWKNTGEDARVHPTQKPVALYRWLLKNYAKEGWSILDTHMGSQSSRIAAYDMGFDYTGYELDPEYFSAGCKRFEQFKSQLKMF